MIKNNLSTRFSGIANRESVLPEISYTQHQLVRVGNTPINIDNTMSWIAMCDARLTIYAM